MHDNESMPGDRGQGAFIVYGIAVVFFLYFGFFGAILLDEAVFRTMWFSRTFNGLSPEINQSISEAIRTIYAPLIWIVRHLGGIR